MKRFLKIFFITGILFAPFVFGNVEGFSEIETALNDSESTIQSGFGMAMRVGASIVLPLICVFAGAIIGYFQAKKKTEQQDGSGMKIFLIVAGYILVGVFVWFVVLALLSQVFFRDWNSMGELVINFYRTAAGI